MAIDGHARHRKADDLAPGSEPVNERVALGEHDLEFAFAPAAVKRCAMQLRQPRRVALTCRFDHGGAAAPPVGEPCHHDAGGRAAPDSGSFGGLASGARR
jgi:hypothetical protein